VRQLAWVSLIVSCVFALGFLFIFVDLLVVHLSTANAEMHESWAFTFALFAASVSLAVWSYKTARRLSPS
jgi:hypothetical protein